jgi:hypothetical protein
MITCKNIEYPHIEKISDESFRIYYKNLQDNFEIAEFLKLTIEEYVSLSINNGAHLCCGSKIFAYFKIREDAQKFINEIMEPLMILNKLGE